MILAAFDDFLHSSPSLVQVNSFSVVCAGRWKVGVSSVGVAWGASLGRPGHSP